MLPTEDEVGVEAVGPVVPPDRAGVCDGDEVCRAGEIEDLSDLGAHSGQDKADLGFGGSLA
jgi:hypothetical protein